ncbi:hypothetical protein [Paraflavitalea pollutisoli]|uniref:hypothetical protein n=1 Tax=Paraflavitalea pollutisoli TaxID=3034143 RepID=UPI0023EB798A|nr:hypothetical protein [Paraflavitalea sp. H1-2-19X]
MLAKPGKRYLAALIDFLIVFIIFGVFVYKYGTPTRDWTDGSISYHLGGFNAFVGLIVASSSKKSQRTGDMAAHTIVVQE